MAQVGSHPFDAWRVFLHPAQRSIAYRPSYAGPAMVTGGAGTGKTVTTLHRAVALATRDAAAPAVADPAADPAAADPAVGAEPPILLTTFTRNLADAIERQLKLLTDDPAVLARIEVLNVDRLAYRVMTGALGRQPAIVDPQAWQQLWRQAAERCDLSPVFLQREWEQVILAQGLRAPGDYLTACRHGRSSGLRAEQRPRV